MERVQAGRVYMLPLSSEYMAVLVFRMWTKPWRYKLELLGWGMEPHVKQVPLASNLTKEGVLGYIKLLKG